VQAENLWQSFSEKAGAFVESTGQVVQEGVNPGGYYKAVWCRDASYILRDWFVCGRVEDVMHEMLFIWSHQISAGGEKVIYGRGSPEMQYASQVAGSDVHREFEGALPSTIFRGFSEVYAARPDIDSTALMVSVTAWVLDRHLKSGTSLQASGADVPGHAELRMSAVVARPSVVMDFVVPRLLRAVEYLASRDVDGDGLLEQGHNEDWMDTVLRSGKIVYSQACWILALGSLSSLLMELDKKDEAGRLASMARRAMGAVEDVLWSEKDGTYADLLDTGQRPLTQDVSMYLVAVTENAGQLPARPEFGNRAERTLDALKARIWKDKWPLVTEKELEKTGPWVLHPNEYHNHTFWPWTTGIEMLAHSRFGRIHECHALLSMLASDDTGAKSRAFYEWVNPITNVGSGAYPFRTGISAIRIAIADILARIKLQESR
jgi:hypothetical protein